MTRQYLRFTSAVALALVVTALSCSSTTECDGLNSCTPTGGTGGTGASAGNSVGGNAGGNGGHAGTATGGTSSGGAAGAAGMNSQAGAAGATPCDGACTGTTPVCNAATNTCVECTDKAQCAELKPACDSTTNTCVECTDGPDCTGSAKPFCDKTKEQCVQCLKQADCTSAAASACNAGQCQACTKDAECSNIAGKGVCAAGTCVQCSVANEAACAGRSCNPKTDACTTTAVGTVSACQPCLADSECTGGDQADPDARCVPMKFMGIARTGGFCLRRVSKTCAKPYNIIVNGASLSGASTEAYCGIDQDATRCEAVLDLVNSQSCADGKDTSCGCLRDKDRKCTATGQGGLCKTVGPNANQCTYACGSANQCPGGHTCPSSTYCF